MKMDIALAIMAYNCEPQIEGLLAELEPVLLAQPLVKTVFIIENQSTDDTLKKIHEAVKRLNTKSIFRVIQNPRNVGLGGSHKVALKLCTENKISHLIILHGDHQASPADIPRLLKQLLLQKGMTTLGSRFSDLKKLSGYSLPRTLGNLALNAVYSAATGRWITDLGSGLNIFNLENLNENVYGNFDNEFTFNMDMLLYLVRSKTPFQYVPIRWSTTDQISNAKAFAVGTKTLKTLGEWLLNRNKKGY